MTEQKTGVNKNTEIAIQVTVLGFWRFEVDWEKLSITLLTRPILAAKFVLVRAVFFSFLVDSRMSGFWRFTEISL